MNRDPHTLFHRGVLDAPYALTNVANMWATYILDSGREDNDSDETEEWLIEVFGILHNTVIQ